MSNARTDLTESEILSHAIDTIDPSHLSAVAGVLRQLRLPEEDLERVDHLLEKNRLGTITQVERLILDKYLRVGNFLDLMRARALRELRQNKAA